jgi:hypothetical protein
VFCFLSSLSDAVRGNPEPWMMLTVHENTNGGGDVGRHVRTNGNLSNSQAVKFPSRNSLPVHKERKITLKVTKKWTADPSTRDSS